mmetsp:Transcript_3766/g.5133  ORF Transcript_3766/g.5133 Transcript_3766/m.5133 type:complete len:353 (+) Transcript_3766:4123-5181(+)
MFWRWNLEFRQDIIFGVPARFIDSRPSNLTRQKAFCDEKKKQQCMGKLDKVIKNQYLVKLGKRDILATMHMFDVPKGENDVRMVYHGTKSGLNDTLWTPWFPLPTVEALVRSMTQGTWSGDNDFADQFLNFVLHAELQKYCGIDLSQLFPHDTDDQRELYAMWVRNAMGLKPSPYASVQLALRAKVIMLRNKSDIKNPFHWSKWVFNLPGSELYDPTKSWAYQVRSDGLMAVNVLMYVDDLRVTAPTKELAWRASSHIGKVCSYLGLQDAAQKRSEPSQTPGAWAGSMVKSQDHQPVYRRVTKERWRKTQQSILWFGVQMGVNLPRGYEQLLEEGQLEKEGIGEELGSLNRK